MVVIVSRRLASRILDYGLAEYEDAEIHLVLNKDSQRLSKTISKHVIVGSNLRLHKELGYLDAILVG